jgi:hypothetical protein
MFWFKKKQIVVDCFTTHRSVYELYKPDRAIKFFPDEIKSMPNYYEDVDASTKITQTSGTIRKCIGLLDYYKTGFILPMWTDFICQPKTAVAKETAIAMVQLPFYYSSHDRQQYPGMFEDYFHVKLSSPWLFREKTGVNFMWNSAIWNLHKNLKQFTVVPAAVSYNYQSQTNINIFINKESENFTINSGTPMVHITPISEQKVVIKHHLVDQDEYSKIGIPDDFSKLRPERYLRWIAEKQKAQSKCPFRFN